MNILLCQDIYVDDGNQNKGLNLTEVKEILGQRKTPFKVAFLDYEMNRQPMDVGCDQRPGYVYQEERLSNQERNIFCVQEQTIKVIFEKFSPFKPEQVIPYGIAVRSILFQNNLLSATSLVISLDECKDKAIISIFEGSLCAAPRCINTHDDTLLISEIKRSVHSYFNMNPLSSEKDIVFVSNNEHWLEALKQKALFKGKVIFYPCSNLCLAGMSLAKFAMNFAMPDDIQRHEQHAKVRKRFNFYLFVGVNLLVGIFFMLGTKMQLNTERQNILNIQQKYSELEQELNALYQAKFVGILGHQPHLRFIDIYHDLYQGLPFGYVVQSFLLEKSLSQWTIECEILPVNDSVPVQQFRKRGIFKEAVIKPWVLNKVLGQKINGSIQTKDGYAAVDI